MGESLPSVRTGKKCLASTPAEGVLSLLECKTMSKHAKKRRDNLSKLRKITARNPELWIPSKNRRPDGSLGVPTFDDLPLNTYFRKEIQGGSN